MDASEPDVPNHSVFVTQINARDDEIVPTNKASTQKGQENTNARSLLQTGLNTLQQTLVVKKESEMAKLDEQLARKREEFQVRMEKCAKKRVELQKRQQNIKNQVEKFDQFVKENEAKRKRALQKYQQENRLRLQKEQELERLKVTLDEVKAKHTELTNKVKEYKKYEDYLLKVINILPPDYIKSTDNVLNGLMLRHRTLFETNTSLMKQMDERVDESKHLRQMLDEARQEHSKTLLEMNARLSELHHEQERIQEETQRVEQQYRYKQSDMRTQVGDFGRVVRCIDNLTEKCLKRYDSGIAALNNTERLNKIEEYIQDMQDIIRMVHESESGAVVKVK